MPTYSLDGVALDHPAGCWRLKPGTRRRPLPGVRSVEVVMPGRAGELPVLGLDHETTSLPLEFSVTSRTPGGGDGGYEQMEANLEALSALLGVRHRLMTLRYEAGTIVRVADATITSVSEPEINTGAARARLTAVARIPGVYWRDEFATTWTGSANAANQAVATLAGATGPITDALIRVTGPAVNPAVVDVATGATVTRPSGLLSTERLIIDCATMRAAKATVDTWDPTPGPNVTDVTGTVQTTGPGSAFRWLHLTPAVGAGDPFSRVVLITATATSTTGASKIEIRARRSYL
ncbi:hypothetical protein [Streptosporangium saharense]|uniref:Uncharacterized protein n=1 Tax=Streptosporangium saharense TaxID=1706840 RepID=A0A7W7QL51_9ACTN|nr:hypothetical protein [Streptosporangium saharense]MBB4915101.1 hypothetical protein [Streptosporangium saharense]